mmetsp:Transcript_13212/g.21625  ORF Transcript_13212/g.21625 Transcript_13212/m.21625 type:complete len:219 (+) Transcript_13212:102-758(+)
MKMNEKKDDARTLFGSITQRDNITIYSEQQTQRSQNMSRLLHTIVIVCPEPTAAIGRGIDLKRMQLSVSFDSPVAQHGVQLVAIQVWQVVSDHGRRHLDLLKKTDLRFDDGDKDTPHAAQHARPVLLLANLAQMYDFPWDIQWTRQEGGALALHVGLVLDKHGPESRCGLLPWSIHQLLHELLAAFLEHRHLQDRHFRAPGAHDGVQHLLTQHRQRVE